MLEKRYWQSKTILANILIAGVCSFVPGAEKFIAEHPVAAINLFCALQLILRKFTHGKVR